MLQHLPGQPTVVRQFNPSKCCLRINSIFNPIWHLLPVCSCRTNTVYRCPHVRCASSCSSVTCMHCTTACSLLHALLAIAVSRSDLIAVLRPVLQFSSDRFQACDVSIRLGAGVRSSAREDSLIEMVEVKNSGPFGRPPRTYSDFRNTQLQYTIFDKGPRPQASTLCA